MSVHIAQLALEQSVCMEILYDDFQRQVEVHAVGYSRENNPLVRAYQINGGSRSGEDIGWKLLRADRFQMVSLNAHASGAPRIGYKRGDKAMGRIICEL